MSPTARARQGGGSPSLRLRSDRLARFLHHLWLNVIYDLRRR